MSATDTRPLPVQPAPRRRRHRGWNALIALVVLLALLIVAAVIGDNVFRSVAEQQVARSVEQGLPQNVRGTVTAKIGGFSAFQQYLSGRFDTVHLTSRGLTVDGQPASISVTAHDLPVKGTGTLRDVTGTFGISQATLTALGPIAGTNASSPKLGNGTVSTSIVEKVLGLPITVQVTLVPSARGQYIHLSPTKAQLKSGTISVPADAIVKTLLPDGVSVCAAKYLPPGLRLTTVDARPSTATFSFVAPSLDLGALQRGDTGHC